jgi:hypothetical protein
MVRTVVKISQESRENDGDSLAVRTSSGLEINTESLLCFKLAGVVANWAYSLTIYRVVVVLIRNDLGNELSGSVVL